MSSKSWVLYMLECNDGTLYTGITNDLHKRIKAHNEGQGAKYTKGRGPVQVVYTEDHPNRSLATQREIHLKKYSRQEKLNLIKPKL